MFSHYVQAHMYLVFKCKQNNLKTSNVLNFDAVWIFPQKCAPSVGRNKPMTRSLKKTQKVKANAQGYSHLPTHLMVSIDRFGNYLSKKVSLGTQIFILCQIWQLEKQFYEKVNKFWLVNYEIEQAATYKKSHSGALLLSFLNIGIGHC